MATDKTVSSFIESQVPEYLREEGPKLVAFLKAYYEWMETTNQLTDASKNLLNNQDIDTTSLSGFYDYFRKEVLADFPTEILADKRLVVKRIKDLYQTKGSKLSFKLLFRILYDEEIDFINPADFILKTSDGRWVRDQLVNIHEPIVGDIDSMVGQFVTGQTSGARGKCTAVAKTIQLGIQVRQFTVTNVVGTFRDREVILADNGVSGTITSALGALVDVVFNNPETNRGGSGHQLGDSVRFISSTGTGATGVVSGTKPSGVTFRVIDGGSGYRVATPLAANGSGLLVGGSSANNSPKGTTATVSGGTGIGGSVTVLSIGPPYANVFVYTDKIQAVANTRIGFGQTYGDSANTDTFLASANLESANAYTTLGSALGTIAETVGSVNAIAVTTGNYEVNLPGVSTIDNVISVLEVSDGSGGYLGKNAVISPVFIPGAITDVTVNNGGSLYSSVFPVTIQNTTRTGTADAIGSPIVSGVSQTIGRFTDSRGFLSWNMRLQDNYYYQEYSYVIKSQRGLQVYRDIVKNVLHPAGSKLFGQINLQDEIDFAGQFDVEETIYLNLIKAQTNTELTIPSTTRFSDDTVLSRTIESGTILPSSYVYGGPVQHGTFVSNTNVVSFGFDVNAIDPTTVVSSPQLNFAVYPGTILPSSEVYGAPVFGSVVSTNNQLSFTFDLPSIGSTTSVTETNILLLPGDGTVSVSNNEIIDPYLTTSISTLLTDPIVSIGSPLAVNGNNTFFTTIVQSGSTIEIQDIDPGATGNTTYIVDAVLSNTVLTITQPFGGGAALANGIFRYTYDGNI